VTSSSGRGAAHAVVLMSTYNGAAHLGPQLVSLAAQDHAPMSLVVRDDGSTDATRAMIWDFATRAPFPVTLLTGANVGACASFFTLMAEAPADAVILLADQDDIWHPTKVSRAVAAVGDPADPTPRLYCSRLNLVDDTLAAVGCSPLWPRPPSFSNAIVENIATGCTTAFNPALNARVLSGGMPERAIMHDWWLYLAASAFGDVIYDPEPSIDYRLHGANTVGLPRNRLAWFVAKVRRQLAERTVPKLRAQANEFEARFGAAMTPAQRAAIARLNAAATAPTGAWAFARQSDVRRQFRSDTLALNVLLGLTALGLLER